MADDYGLQGMLEALNEHKSLTDTRQQAQIEQQKAINAAAQTQADITRQNSAVSQNLMKSLEGEFSTIDKLAEGKQTQEALRSSGDVGDFLQFVGNQVSDPGTYTRKGRAKKLAESSNMISMRTQVAGLQQAALADLSKIVVADLEANGGKLAIANLLEAQSAERLNAEVARVEQQTNLLSQNRALAAQKLATMTIEETKAAAVKAGGKSIDIGGVIISAGDLEARVAALDEADLLAQTRQLAIKDNQMELVKRLGRKELELKGIPELREIVLSGNENYDLKDADEILKMKTTAEAAGITAQVQEYTLSDFGASTLVPAIQELDRIAPSIPKNSPLEQSFNGYKSAIIAVTTQLQTYREAGRPMTLPVVAAANEALSVAKGEFDKAIEKEAKLKSRGDKNLQDIYTEVYRGNPAPRAPVEAALMERLDKNEPLTDVLPPETAKLVQTLYSEKYQNALRANVMNTVDRKTLKEQAIQEAIQEGVQQTISERTNDLFWNQTQIPDNPLAGILKPNQIMGMVAESDARATETFAKTYQLNDEELNVVLAGGEVPGKVDAAGAANLAVMQNQEFLMKLDSLSAGRAKQYIDWWNTKGNEYIEKTRAARIEQSKAAGVQESAMETYASAIEGEQIAAYRESMNQAYDSYEGLKEQRYQEMISFDLQPNHRQAALLQFDESLTDAERQTFMRELVMPLIRDGQKRNMDYDDINAAVERAIDSNVAPNPTVAKILKKVAANRPKIVNQIESVMEKPFWRKSESSPRIGFQPNAWLRRTVAQRSFAWYEEVLQGE